MGENTFLWIWNNTKKNNSKLILNNLKREINNWIIKMDGQELTADQFLQQTDSSVMNSIQSFVQHANNLEETLGITSSWYLQTHLEFPSWKSKLEMGKWTFVTILKPRFCQVSSKITWKYFHFNYLNCTFAWNGSKLELLNVPKSKNDPSWIFFRIFSRGKLTILRPPTF